MADREAAGDSAVGLAHGLPGSKKTWTVLHLGVSVAAGLPTCWDSD